MEVIKSKIKLFNRKRGAVEVFLSGISVDVSEGLERVIAKYLDTESNYTVIREQYVAYAEAPKKTK